MLQRLIAALLGLLGVASIGLGVASATIWRADDPLVATAAPGGDTRTLITDPGVLELAGDPVTVTVRADGSPVVLAVGRDTDVNGWIGDDPYARVTGLADWHTLATTAGEPADPAEPTASPTATATPTSTPSPSESGAASSGEQQQAADPTGSDLWVVEVAGDGSATLEWPAQDGRWSLIAVSLGESAPTLDLSWPQTVTTPWLWPGVALGVLLLAIAAVLLVRILRQRREGADAGWHSVTTGQSATVGLASTDTGAPSAAGTATGAVPTVEASGTTGAIPVATVTPDGAPLTRRAIREAEAAAAAARRKGRRTATGAIPAVTGAIPTVTGAIPTFTGATPAVTGATRPGSTEPTTPGRSTTPPGPSAPPPSSAGAPSPTGAPSTSTPTTATGPGSGAVPPAGTVPTAAPRGAGTPGATATNWPVPATVLPGSAPGAGPATAPPVPLPAAPNAASAPAAEPGPKPTAEAAEHRRGLAARLPWRRSRQEPAGATAEPTAAPPESGPPAAPTPNPPAAAGTASRAVPGVPPSGLGSGSAGVPPVPPVTPPGQSVGAPPAPRTAPGTGATSEDDPAARAQRADAWRRMWGFPTDEGGPDATTGTPRPTDDAQGPEEGR